MRILIYGQPLPGGPIAGSRAAAILRSGQVIRMMINRKILAGLFAAVISGFSSGILYADGITTPVDISANVIESILPGGTVFHDSKPLFGTTIDPLQSAELLHISDTGVNASARSTNISGAFAPSLAQSDGNGGVGVSQLIFGSPGGSGQDTVRQLVAQSLWTHTFLYDGLRHTIYCI
jgi:hypothetical protein